MRFFLSLFLVISCFVLSAQNLHTDNNRAIKFFNEARNAERARNFDEAMELYKKAISKDEDFAEAYYGLAGIHQMNFNYDKAVKLFEKAIALAPDATERFAMAHYNVGLYYYKNSLYQKAFSPLRTYLMSGVARRPFKERAEKFLQDTEFAIENIKDSVDVDPMKVPDSANVYQYQYFPVLTADMENLYFTVRTDNILEDLYLCKKIGDGWSMPIKMPQPVNSELYNEGTCSVSGDGKTLVFTTCNKPGGEGRCDLYVSYFRNGKWKTPQNLGDNVNSRFWESQPTLSADGRTLYFCSDRPGGKGKRDLYITTRNDSGVWTEPLNLGSPINTKMDDIAPFIHTNGQTLYFASTGHPGYGGFDLFKTSIQANGKWQEPKNLQYPLNTIKDEVSFFITSDGKMGYYSVDEYSKMEANRSFLFQVELPKSVSVDKISSIVKGHVYEAESNNPLEANVELYDLKTNKKVFDGLSDGISGQYLAVLTEGSEYALYVQKEGYIFESLFFDFKDVNSFKSSTLNVYLEPIKKGKSITLNNIFFETDSYDLDKKSKTELSKAVQFLNDNSDLDILIEGHTDNTGSSQYNLKLSKNRAKSVYSYLIDNGISASRLSFVGKGSSEPVLPNTSEENKRKNRRIEFILK